MAIPKLEEDLSFIAKMADDPRSDGLTTEEFKAEFDKAALAIQKYLNDTIIPALEMNQGGGIVVGPTPPAFGPCLWLNTNPHGALPEGDVLVRLDEDAAGHEVLAQVEEKTFGLPEFTVNQGVSPGKYDFTVK